MIHNCGHCFSRTEMFAETIEVERLAESFGHQKIAVRRRKMKDITRDSEPSPKETKAVAS